MPGRAASPITPTTTWTTRLSAQGHGAGILTRINPAPARLQPRQRANVVPAMETYISTGKAQAKRRKMEGGSSIASRYIAQQQMPHCDALNAKRS